MTATNHDHDGLKVYHGHCLWPSLSTPLLCTTGCLGDTAEELCMLTYAIDISGLLVTLTFDRWTPPQNNGAIYECRYKAM